MPGYILGGVLYFGIPWALGTTMGLAAVGLQNNPIWPAFGRSLTMTETADGLPLGYAALAVAGKGGAVAVVVLIFMAVTSTCSAQIIAVSSIVSSDIYHTYVNPTARDRSVITVSRYACVGFAIVGCGVSTGFYYAGLSLTWTLYWLGIIVCPGMVVLPLTIFWKRQTRLAAIISPLVGMACGIIVWLTTAWYYAPGGVLNVTTTGELLPCLWGTIASAGVPPILTVLISLARPEPDWNWNEFSKIKLVHHDDDSASTLVADHKGKDNSGNEQKVTVTALEEQDGAPSHFTDAEIRYMKKASWWAGGLGIFLFLAVWVLWPLIMYGQKYVFSASFFTGWITVAFIWLWAALLIVTFLPPIEGRRTWKLIITGLVRGKAQAQRGLSANGGDVATASSPSSTSSPFSPSEQPQLRRESDGTAITAGGGGEGEKKGAS